VQLRGFQLDGGGGRKGWLAEWSTPSGLLQKAKKEEFSGFMENMLPENSFPQICVVSVNKYVENVKLPQEYGWALTLSNYTYILSSN
jgi:hypothetical protein